MAPSEPTDKSKRKSATSDQMLTDDDGDDDDEYIPKGQKRKRQHSLRKAANAKRFSCNYCDYTTDHVSSIRPHERTHTGERPFKCLFCPYASTTNSNLKTHTQRHHQHEAICK